MLEPSVVAEVERLLERGTMSHRKIALATGVSRSSVAAIASGARRVEPRPAGRACRPGYVEPMPPRGWCPRCGANGYVPCVACEARNYQTRQRAGRYDDRRRAA